MHSSGPSWRENTKEEVRSGKTQQTEDDQKKLRVVEPGISQETKFAQMLSSNIVNYRCSTSAVAGEGHNQQVQTKWFYRRCCSLQKWWHPPNCLPFMDKNNQKCERNPIRFDRTVYIIYAKNKLSMTMTTPRWKYQQAKQQLQDRCPNHRAGCPLSPSPTFQAGLDANKKSCFGNISYMSVTERIRVYTYIYI